MKLERLLIARLECSPSVYFCTRLRTTSICNLTLCWEILQNRFIEKSFYHCAKSRNGFDEFCI